MKLHELVHLRNQLQQSLQTSAIRHELEQNISNLKNLKLHSNDTYSEQLESIAAAHSRFFEELEQDQSKVQQLIEQIDRDIADQSTKFFANNYQLEMALMRTMTR